jgi:ABC-2 type transport system permease protein
MRQALDIMKKEFKSYFVTPIAYIVISIFLLVTGWFFFSAFFLYNQASLRGFFSLLPYSFAFVIPAVAMRLFAEELGTGSYEILLTLPVSFRDVILGKFFAAVAFTAVMLIPTLFYPVTISFLGDLDWGPVLGGTIGALFLGAAFAAIGLFASSLTRNQIVAYITGMTLCFALALIDKMLFFLPSSWVRVIEYMAADFHFQNIAKGVIDSRDILYFISVAFIALYGTSIVLQEKN